MEQQWWKEAVVYQIYPRSFKDSNGDGIGDIQGIISKLDYLKLLGIDVIWLSPVYDSPNDDNGYDIRNYTEIMQEFGSMEDIDELIAEAHRKGIKIVMDLVVNHTSDEHEWFLESKSSKDNPKRDFYIWREGNGDEAPNNWESMFRGSAWEYNEPTEDYYLHLFSKKQPDLNWENPALRQEVYKMMTWWAEKGIDGFRMDVINFISKHPDLPDGEKSHGKEFGNGAPFFMNGPKIHDYLQEMNKEVLSRYDLMTVGEMPGVDVEEARKYTDSSRNEVNMVFQFEHMGVGDGVEEGKWSNNAWELNELKEILSRWQNGLETTGWNSLYWNNHDQPRVVSRFGNDGQYRVESAKMLATLLHMMKGTPYIYQGEELGMTNSEFTSVHDFNDIESINSYYDLKNRAKWDEEKIMNALKARSRDNARTPVQWDQTEHAGFTTGNPWLEVNPNYNDINAEKCLADKNSVFYYYQKLIQLRKTYPIIVHGKYELIFKEHPQLFAYERHYEGKKLVVLCSFSPEKIDFDYPSLDKADGKELLISNYSQENQPEALRPYEARVYLI
ncbi:MULTISPECIES: glycoside hydrolase family 13 protein [Bacillus]|uniref:oligo-1,6-glucosidase n=2 Tax=Bacillus TaxID=1386 RepID=A0A0M4FUJ4_9BACI|nr:MULTISPECIES: alpha-glucosidase [Bacillus]ALC83559.1 oligo-1,6-glucosidase [Bacillus gobiensis]MBP1082547.1 oligo-1,6-glucosidase [Bacillus capparidis]MED1097222.1 alpha-glucosidase [Bacillus capparidis]